MAVPNAAQRIEREVMSWDGIEGGPHPSGGRQYRFRRREVGHVHGDHLVEVPFPPDVRDEVIAAGLAEPTAAASDRVSKPLRKDLDVEIAVALLRRAYAIAVNHARQAGEIELDPVDQAGRESFPASDPPSWNP